MKVNMVQTAVGFEHQKPSASSKVQHGGGGGTDAHLVLDGAAGNAIALALLPWASTLNFGDNEKRNATRAPGASGRRASTMCTMLSVRSCSRRR